MSKVVLIVAAHPDDEVLGVGGAAARHAEEGDTVHVVIAAEGATSRDVRRDTSARQDDLGRLKSAANAAAKILGTLPPRFFDFPDNRMDAMARLDVIKPIEALVEEVRPMIVYTHFRGDLNVDHTVLHDAVLTACRPLPGCPVRSIYAFETTSSTEWSALNTFDAVRYVDISRVIDRKMQALEAYEVEMRKFPHARSLEAVRALATVRGAHVGCEAAEAFKVIREIV